MVNILEVSGRVDIFLFVCSYKFFVILDFYGFINNFINIGYEDVNGFGYMGISDFFLYVEGFDFDGEVGEEDGMIDFIGYFVFGGFSIMKY